MSRQPKIENLNQVYARVKDNIHHRTSQPEYPTGVGGVDDMTRGFPKGKISIIASRPSEGKTSLALQSAVHLANTGKSVAFISIEDDAEMCAERIICNVFEIDNYELAKGRVERLDECDSVIQQLFKRLKISMLDSYGYNFEEFKNVVLNAKPKPEVVFFDYIQLVEYKEKEKYSTIDKFLRDAHQLAMQEKIAIVINSQINRGGAEAKRPHIHNLEWAGTLEQIAYLIIIIHTPAKHGDTSFDYNKQAGTGMKSPPTDYVEFQVEKNKTGRTGILRARFIGKHFKFAEWIL